MSNKTIFQEKNTRLNANNTDLASILETINNLPEAGGGGSTMTTMGCSYSTEYGWAETIIEKDNGFIESGATYHIKWLFADGSTIEDNITLSEIGYGMDGYEGYGANSCINAMHISYTIQNASENMYVVGLTFNDPPSTPPYFCIVTKQ